MKTYIALLRGINVGGKNKVPMTELKILFETIGFINVTTYINSGNIIFTSNIKKEENHYIILLIYIINKLWYNIIIVYIEK